MRDPRLLPTGPVLLVIVLALASGCYNGAEAARDTNLAWRGRSQGTLVAEWGRPAQVIEEPSGKVLRYSFSTRRITLPKVSGFLDIGDNYVEGAAAFRPGTISRYRTDILVAIAGGRILQVEGPSLRWGPPDEANMRWGTIFGVHAGMGTLDDTGTPLPSGGMYLGGMLSPTLGLVGTFSMAAGSDDDGGALAFAWGLAPQKWLHTRVWVRTGPAMILAFDPGFENAGLEPGVTGSASFAVVRSGNFVLDLRADIAVGTDTVFGTAGIGVNVN